MNGGTTVCTLCDVLDWSKIISTGVGPIIVISACGLLCLAFYNRMAAVVARLRSFQRERLESQEALARARAEGGDAISTVRHQEILGMLQTQTDRVIQRARLIQRALICMLSCVGSLVICSMSVGLSAVWPRLIIVAAVMFVIGLAVLLVGVIYAIRELVQALDPVELEMRCITSIVEEFERLV